jgi:hypothetical protein
MNFFGSKTKAGAILLAIGVAIYNTVDLCPVSTWVPWIKYVGALVSAAGGALGLVGIGGKVDKATAAVASAQTSAQISSFSAAEELQRGPAPLTEESFRRLLSEARGKKEPPK